MALEKDYCTSSGDSLEYLQHTDDDFVWVFHRALNCDSTISSDEQNENFESRSVCIHSNLNEDQDIINGIESDFLEDSSYNPYYDQFEPILQKVSHYKKPTKQRQRRGISSKTIHNPEEDEEAIHPALNMFDETTTGILKSIVAYNNYYHGQFCNFISKGGKSVVVYASILKKTYPLWHPKVKSDFYTYHRLWKSWRTDDYAVKVYKLSENVEKNEQIFKQVEIEKEHLLLLHRAKCNVPEVKRCNRNVIATSMLGAYGETAPSISTLPLKPLEIYRTIIKDMKMWYNMLHLVHGQLSPTNILYWNDKVHYIGWSHSIKKDHPLALKKLMRDCVFITKFFEERFVPVKSSENLFKDVTGLTEIDNSVLSRTHSMDLWKRSTLHLANPNRVSSHTQSKGSSSRFKRL